MSAPRPHDKEYDRGAGLGRPVLRAGGVWASLLAVSALLVVVAFMFLGDDTPTVPDAEVDRTTTTVDPHDGWVVGGCAEFDIAGRVSQTECGEHFAEVVALVSTAEECPESTDFSVPLTEGVACFAES